MSGVVFKMDGDGSFHKGQNTFVAPSSLPPGAYARAENMVCRGGVLQCRPGFDCLQGLTSGRIQGAYCYRPKEGREMVFIAIEGRVLVSEAPFDNLRLLPNVRFSETAAHVYFESAIQSVSANSDGSLTFVSPERKVLIMQDGGLSAPAYFDGSQSGHLRDDIYGIPSGGSMKWVGDRLWVAVGNALIPSDISNPFSFREGLLLGATRSIFMPEAIVALAVTPSSDYPELLAFTLTTTSLIRASVRDRSTWLSIENFKRVLFPRIGCVAPRSIVTHFGMLWWFSPEGLISLNSALVALQDSFLPFQDNEMIDSKSRLSSDLSGISIGTHENYLMVSVPYSDHLNTHTWVLDQTTVESFLENSGPVWNSVWTGTRPQVWISDTVDSRARSLFVSADADGVNRLWSAFSNSRLDNGCPIVWSAELRAYVGEKPVQPKYFRFARLFFSELSGDVDIAVFWAGINRGGYKRCLTKRIKATMEMPSVISSDTLLVSFKKQSRTIKTEYANTQTVTSDEVERNDSENIDEAFQIFITGSGPAALSAIAVYLEDAPGEGRPRVEHDETNASGVRADGYGQTAETVDEVYDQFSALPGLNFSSTKSMTYSRDGQTASGFGTAVSMISQADADKRAQCIANMNAGASLVRKLPLLVGQP